MSSNVPPRRASPPAVATDADLLQLGRRALRELPDAPAWLVHRAEALWRAPIAPAPTFAARATAALRAVLSFDSFAMPVPAVRSAADERQLLFVAGAFDIDLRLRAHAGGWAASGQVLGPAEGGRLEFAPASGGPPTRSVAIDELGAFEIGSLAAGEWHVWLDAAGVRVELPPLSLAPPSPAPDA
jgi:hypothetical protein